MDIEFNAGTLAARRTEMRILVAEDDVEMRRLVVEGLRKEGYDVLEAEDGQQLLDLLAASRHGAPLSPPVDLIISDVRMPHRNALDVLEELEHCRSCLPIIFMTAFPNEDTRRRAGRIGALILDKPLSMQALRSAVRCFDHKATNGA